MKVICAIVASVDGKTTKNNNPDVYHWSSKEDTEYFFSLRDKNNLLIMGRKTYDHAKHLMEHKKGMLRVVLTKTPEKFLKQSKPNILEFTNDSLKNLLKKLSNRGYKQALLLGGATTNTSFAKDHLIDEVWITFEPYLFGKGNSIFDNEFTDLSLRLISSKKLNTQGTLLLKYKILK